MDVKRWGTPEKAHVHLLNVTVVSSLPTSSWLPQQQHTLCNNLHQRDHCVWSKSLYDNSLLHRYVNARRASLKTLVNPRSRRQHIRKAADSFLDFPKCNVCLGVSYFTRRQKGIKSLSQAHGTMSEVTEGKHTSEEVAISELTLIYWGTWKDKVSVWHHSVTVTEKVSLN